MSIGGTASIMSVQCAREASAGWPAVNRCSVWSGKASGVSAVERPLEFARNE
jgi:hypothetical protein